MAVIHKKLWNIFTDRSMKNKNLCVASKINHASMAKIKKNDNVATGVLVKICSAISCNIGDIMEVTNEK